MKNQTQAQSLTIFGLIANFDNLDFKAVCTALVEQNPLHLLAVVKSIQNAFPVVVPDYVKEVIDLLDRDQYVPAIKRLREGTGSGLKEAKFCVDALRGRTLVSDLSDAEKALFHIFTSFGLKVKPETFEKGNADRIKYLPKPEPVSAPAPDWAAIKAIYDGEGFGDVRSRIEGELNKVYDSVNPISSYWIAGVIMGHLDGDSLNTDEKAVIKAWRDYLSSANKHWTVQVQELMKRGTGVDDVASVVSKAHPNISTNSAGWVAKVILGLVNRDNLINSEYDIVDKWVAFKNKPQVLTVGDVLRAVAG